MKISVITVALNRCDTIRDAIESVLSQTLPAEHIIVDGGSSDGTLEMVRSYGRKIAQVVSEPDHGIYDAMNKGIRLATGDVVGILNADDFFTNPVVLEKVASVFEEKKVDSVYGDLEYVHPVQTGKVMRTWKSGPFEPRDFLMGWMLPHPTFFVKKCVYDQYGLYLPEFSSAGDYEMMVRLLYKYRISAAYLPEVLVRMRTGGVSNRNLLRRLAANAEDRQAWKVNGIRAPFYTTILKPLRKVGQFI
ncbi:MAG: glycosyltransferase [Saprospirales bacterium]|nr:glycosyltransferase [Saprospirales bacterium]